MNIVETANVLLSRPKKQELNTKMIRKISQELFHSLPDKSINTVIPLCEELLENRDAYIKVIAFDFAYRVRREYSDATFPVFENWMQKYVVDWWDCDDFCTHALGYLLSIRNDLFKEIIKWTSSSNFAVRRAAAVVLIYPIKKGKYTFDPFVISDILMEDQHYLVQKGYGWMLKELSKFEPNKVCDYLVKNKMRMPRTAYRYALEKMDKTRKEELMKR